MSRQLPASPVRRHRPAPRKWLRGRVLLLAVVVGILASACSYTLPGRGSYPLDIFYEMHYQQSYKSNEPPRLSGVADAVAWFPAPRSTAFETNTGSYLFAVNCSMCHGADGKGSASPEGPGPVLKTMVERYGYSEKAPTDLTAFPPAFIEDVIKFTPEAGRPRYFGEGSVMPPFGKLLSSEEIRAIALYIGTPSAAPAAGVQPPPPPVSAGGMEISVKGDALEFDRGALPEVVAGTEVVLVFTNASSINQHNWVLVSGGTKDAVASRGTTAGPGQDWLQPDDPDVIAHTKLLFPGENGEVRFTAPPAGAYQFVCTFPGHNATMFGDFVVVP